MSLELPPNQEHVFGSWKVSLEWTIAKTREGREIGRTAVRMFYGERLWLKGSGINAFGRACEMAKHFHQCNYIPKPVPKVRADYEDYRTRRFRESEDQMALDLADDEPPIHEVDDTTSDRVPF